MPDHSTPLTSHAELEALCNRLSSAPHVAVDTEFIRDRTYFARLCLIQIASPTEHAIIDPLALRDLLPLKELMAEPGVVKVFHAGSQDLEIFHDLWGIVPSPIFDTQLAATFLGFGAQVGYARLVQDAMGVELDKAGTLTDWSRRPLTAEQLRYAAADVTHLVPLYEKLLAMLLEQKREAWLATEMLALSDPEAYKPKPEEAWRHVRGGGAVKGPAAAVLRALAAWRESEARQRDLPRRWVLPDESLVEVARRKPRTMDELSPIRGIPERALEKAGRAILDVVARAAAEGEGVRPVMTTPERVSVQANAVADLMACLVRLRAAERGVSAGQLATRGALEALAMHGEAAEAQVLEGWRREMVGDDLLALRKGTLRLAVRDGSVVIERD